MDCEYDRQGLDDGEQRGHSRGLTNNSRGLDLRKEEILLKRLRA